MNIIGLSLLLTISLTVLLGSPINSLLAVVSGVLYLTSGQHVMIGSINFFAIRIIEIAGLLRVIIKKEINLSNINPIDRSFLAFQSAYLLIYLLRSYIEPSSIETRTYRIGYFIDGIICYFLFRYLIKDQDFYENFLNRLALLLVPFSFFMVLEATIGRNLFVVMGGIPESPVWRSGYYRAQGSFGVAITAGCFAASLLPMFFYKASISKGRLSWAHLGIFSCLSIVLSSHSSGPLVGTLAGITCLLLWPLRKQMRSVRWATVIFLIVLQLMMKAPIWFIPARISGVIGGDGWHRSNLIDKCIGHFSNWWFMGMPLEKTADWAATRLESGAVDMTSGIISIAVSGGLITLFLFLIFLTKCFRTLGQAMKEIRILGQDHVRNERLLWSIGSSLIVHIVNISGVAYWDQSYVIWYFCLATISSMTSLANKSSMEC